MKAKVVETDPYAYVYRSETPKFDGITGSSAIRVEKSSFVPYRKDRWYILVSKSESSAHPCTSPYVCALALMPLQAGIRQSRQTIQSVTKSYGYARASSAAARQSPAWILPC